MFRRKQLAIFFGATLPFLVSGQEAGRIDLGGFDLIPSLQYSQIYDDNVARSSENEIDSWVSVIEPEIILLNNFSTNQLQFGYRLSRGEYYSSGEDEYTDHLFSAAFHYEINNRHRLDIEGQYLDGHDDRGTAFSIGLGDTLVAPDTFKNSEFGLTYSYGVDSAAARLDLSYRFKQIDYDGEQINFLARDREFQSVYSSFYYRLAPRTDFVFDIGHKDISYDISLNPENPLDSEELRALIGVKWESTAATSGYLKIGYQQKEFDSALREKFDGVDWEIGVIWEPVKYSTIELSTSNDTQETNGEGNFIETKSIQLSWNHNWLERFSSSFSIDVDKDRYEREANVREDDIIRTRIGAKYQFRRWIQFELAYIFDQRDSNRDLIDYDRNQYRMQLLLTL